MLHSACIGIGSVDSLIGWGRHNFNKWQNTGGRWYYCIQQKDHYFL